MAKVKGGLGCGINTLLPNYEEITHSNDNGIRKVSIDELFANENQPRKDFDEDELIDLKESIKEHGIIQPLIVCKKENGYMIVAGERRFRAAKMANLTDVPVIIKDLSEQEIVEIALIENIQRANLNIVEEARGYKKLVDDYAYTAEQLAKRLGKSRPQITNTMRLLQLPEDVLLMLEEKKITAGHARALLGLNNIDWQIEMAMDIYENGLSVRDVEKIVNNFKDSNDIKVKAKPVSEKLSIQLKTIEEQLKMRLGTKVSIKNKGEGGKIEIQYYTEDDLKRVIDAMGGEFY